LYQKDFEKSILGIETLLETLDIPKTSCYNNTVDHRDVAHCTLQATLASTVARLLWEHAGGFRFLIFQILENP